MASKRRLRRVKEKRIAEGKYDFNDKAICEQFHALKRFKERFGMRLTLPEYDGAVKDIMQNRSMCIYHESHRLSHHLVQLKNIVCCAVYDRQRHKIVTFLTPEMCCEER